MKIILADFSEIPYESDNGLNFVTAPITLEQCNAYEALLTPDNLKNVELAVTEAGHREQYANLILVGTEEVAVYGEDGETLTGYTLHIHLREKTDVEALTERVDALEESQATQDGAIDDLGEAVSGLYEEA